MISTTVISKTIETFATSESIFAQVPEFVSQSVVNQQQHQQQQHQLSTTMAKSCYLKYPNQQPMHYSDVNYDNLCDCPGLGCEACCNDKPDEWPCRPCVGDQIAKKYWRPEHYNQRTFANDQCRRVFCGQCMAWWQERFPENTTYNSKVNSPQATPPLSNTPHNSNANTPQSTPRTLPSPAPGLGTPPRPNNNNNNTSNTNHNNNHQLMKMSGQMEAMNQQLMQMSGQMGELFMQFSQVANDVSEMAHNVSFRLDAINKRITSLDKEVQVARMHIVRQIKQGQEAKAPLQTDGHGQEATAPLQADGHGQKAKAQLQADGHGQAVHPDGNEQAVHPDGHGQAGVGCN